MEQKPFNEKNSSSDCLDSQASHVEDAQQKIDPAAERKAVRKIDMFVMPVLFTIYLSCFIDRANIGNVKVAGMPEDVGASESQFSTAISLFFITYIIVEIPFVIISKRVTPRVALVIPCLVWTAATIANGFVTSVGGLYACRLVLGAAEGGLFPSLNLYLTLIYKRDEIAQRVSYFLSASAISGAVGGLLAYGLLQMEGVGGLPGWRWVYIIEGAASFIGVFMVWFGIPSDIRNAYFFNAEEKKIMQIRHVQRLEYLGEDKFSWEEVRNAFTDPKIWMNACSQFCHNLIANGFATFLPAMLKDMGHDKLAANYLTVPVGVLSAIVFFVVAWASDRFDRCGPILVVIDCLGIIGYVMLLVVKSNAVKYFACFICGVASFNGVGLNLTWLSVNLAPQYRRATAIGIVATIGNSSGIVAGQIYRKSPYILGKAFSVGAVTVALILVASQWAYLQRLSKEKEAIKSGEKEENRKLTTGDRDVNFKYRI